MQLKAVIFDMDGLLIDSEPFWEEAGVEILQEYGYTLTHAQYKTSVGLRTEEWVDHWFRHFGISPTHAPEAVAGIIQKAIDKIDAKARLMPGSMPILDFFRSRQLPIGLATSSPLALVEVVLKKFGLGTHFDAIASAEFLPHGKPHPQVYLNCAEALKQAPYQCLAFEDSFNGMIAAKAARMKCVVVPAPALAGLPQWHAADLVIPSLEDFNEKHLNNLI